MMKLVARFLLKTSLRSSSGDAKNLFNDFMYIFMCNVVFDLQVN